MLSTPHVKTHVPDTHAPPSFVHCEPQIPVAASIAASDVASRGASTTGASTAASLGAAAWPRSKEHDATNTTMTIRFNMRPRNAGAAVSVLPSYSSAEAGTAADFSALPGDDAAILTDHAV